MPQPRILLDCRWLNSGGAGRVTELLLRGLAERRMPARWILWGPAEVETLAWPGAEIVIESHDPRAMKGQRSWFTIPNSDIALFMHQQRPQRRMRSVTMIYDTIPLRFASGVVDRAIKRRFLERAAGLSTHVVTTSEYSRNCILSDLRVPREKVSVVRLPGDPELACRVGELRRTLQAKPTALYLGLFLPHKNLERLIEAFGRTRFCGAGGRLLLMGGGQSEHRTLAGKVTAQKREYVDMRPFSSQEAMEEALATARFLVQPSLEEGFGLPAWEALCCGLPVCASDGGALPEITRGLADEFPAGSTDRMVAALDACAARAALTDADTAQLASRQFLATVPSIHDFAGQMQKVIERALGRS